MTVSVRGRGSKRQKILRALDRLAQPLQEFLQMLAPVDKVDLGGINHQQVTGLATKEEVLVRMHHFFSVSSYACKYITKSGMGMCSDY